MIRFASEDDRSGVRALLRQCFTRDTAYLDHFLTPDPARKLLCCIEGGRVVGTLSGFQLDYISRDIDPDIEGGAFHKNWHGFYLYGLCADEAYRGQGIATRLIEHFAEAASAEGRDFLLLRPMDGDPLLSDFYRSRGFTLELRRKSGLPAFEDPANITHLRATELFLLRQRTLQSDYFQWSPPLLHYIIKEARLNPKEDSSEAEQKGPWAMLRPLNPNFRLSSSDAVFSYPMD